MKRQKARVLVELAKGWCHSLTPDQVKRLAATEKRRLNRRERFAGRKEARDARPESHTG